MATILTGYAYTTSLNSYGMKLNSAAAFNPDYDTPILKDHPARDGKPETVVGHLLTKRHDARGMVVDVLVFDDALAAKVRGFSIGTTKKAYLTRATGMPLNEISICVDCHPSNPDCTIKSRRPADHMHVNLALYGQQITAHFKLQKLAVVALRTLIEAHLTYARESAS